MPRPQGKVRLTLVSKHGSLVIPFRSNLVVNGYKSVTAQLLGQQTGNLISKIAVGTGGNVPGDPTTPVPPLATDTALATQLGSPRNIDTIIFPFSTEVQFTTTFLTSEVNGVLTEAGLFAADDTMVARVTFAGVNKTSAFSLVVDWVLFF